MRRCHGVLQLMDFTDGPAAERVLLDIALDLAFDWGRQIGG